MTWRFKSRFQRGLGQRRWRGPSPSRQRGQRRPETAWRLLPGSAVALLVGGLWQLGALVPLEQLGYTSLFQLRGERAWAEPIVLISIDDESLRRLGRYPWPRRYYTQLLQTLSATDQQPSAIAFDLILSEPSPEDAQLAQAIEQQGRVALGQVSDFQGLPLLPVPVLRSAAMDTGFLSNHRDADGLIRSAQLRSHNDAAFGVVATQIHAFSQPVPPLPNLEPPLWINWPGPVQRLPHYSFADVLERRIPATAWQHKIVLVGITATGFDTLLTPFNRSTPGTGVYYHAAVIDNLLKRNSLRVWERSALPWLLLGLTPALGWLLSGQRTGRQVLLGLGGCVLWGLGSWGLLYANQWLPMALPIGLGLGTTLAVVLCERLRMNHFLQQQVQHLWQTYPPLALPTALPGIGPVNRPPVGSRLQGSVTGDQPPRSASLQTAQQLADLAEQLGRAQATQAAIARSLSVGVLAAERDGPIWFCNPPAAQWLGVSLGQSLQAQLVPAWLSLDEWQADLYVLQQGVEVPAREVYRGDRWFQFKLEPLDTTPEALNPLLKSDSSNADPSSRSVESNIKNGVENSFTFNSSSFLMLLEDITSRKQIETNLTRQIQELEWISKLKDDFLSTVSHELRAPLTNMGLAIQLLKTAQTEPKRDHYLSILATECRREGDLINDLLDLQRLEKSEQQLQLRPIDLTLWLPPLVQTFQTRAASRQQHLQFQLERTPLVVVSEQSSLERILTELLNNACKYTPPAGKILLTAAVTQPSANASPPQMTIIVQNSGITIAPQELPRIFDKFYRVPKGDPWQQGGTGLGLALVQRLVEQIQGKIEVTSSADRTQFILQLPAPLLVR